MRTIISKSEQLDNIEINIFKDSCTKAFHNFFIEPNIGLKLYNCKVGYIDYKTISFSFNLIENRSLLLLLDNIHNSIQVATDKYRENFGLVLKPINKMYYIDTRNKNVFYIKCNLPNRNGKYLIDYYDSAEIGSGINNKVFNRPLVKCVYHHVIIDIRNVFFETSRDITALHLELKQVYN